MVRLGGRVCVLKNVVVRLGGASVHCDFTSHLISHHTSLPTSDFTSHLISHHTSLPTSLCRGRVLLVVDLLSVLLVDSNGGLFFQLLI